MEAATKETRTPPPSDGATPSRYVIILLLSYPDNFSKLFRFISRSRYSHVSIGVSDSDWTFFSYVLKGFRTEKPHKHPTYKTREIPCQLYRIAVTDEQYAVAKAMLEEHSQHAQMHRFSYLGLLLCYMRINLQLKDRYFCSQFVSEILEKSRTLPLAKHSSLYLPDDFIDMDGLEFCYAGNLSQLVGGREPAWLSLA